MAEQLLLGVILRWTSSFYYVVAHSENSAQEHPNKLWADAVSVRGPDTLLILLIAVTECTVLYWASITSVGLVSMIFMDPGILESGIAFTC